MGLFEDTNLCAIHAKRVTIMVSQSSTGTVTALPRWPCLDVDVPALPRKAQPCLACPVVSPKPSTALALPRMSMSREAGALACPAPQSTAQR